MHLIKSLVAAAAVAACGFAHAGPTTTFTIQDARPQGVVSTVSFNGGATTASRSTVEYYGTSTNPAGSFAAFCLEPNVPLGNPQVYDVGAFTSAVAAALSTLFTGAGWQSWNYAADGVTTDIQRVGLGLAVWDIAADGVFDLAGGSFRVIDDGLNGAAVAFANLAYSKGNTSLAGNLLRLSSVDTQDLVIAVPEPSTYALMFAGLGVIGHVVRRRRQRD